MRKRSQDLLICYIGSGELATQLENCFRASYPRISIHAGNMTRALRLIARIRFRVVIVATNSDIQACTGIMVRKICERDYSSSNVFVLNTNRTAVRYKHQFLVEEFTRDKVGGLIEAAKKTADRDPHGRWQTKNELTTNNS
jgi:hypothetical protein